jgi:hypothetical protein
MVSEEFIKFKVNFLCNKMVDSDFLWSLKSLMIMKRFFPCNPTKNKSLYYYGKRQYEEVLRENKFEYLVK